MADGPKQWRVRIGGEREMVAGFSAIGRAIGGTAGQIIHMTRVAATMAARIGPLGLAIGGITAGVIALGKALYDLSMRDLDAAIKKADAATKAFSDLGAEISKTLQTRAMRAAGIGDIGEQLLKVKEAYRNLDMARADLEAQIERVKREGPGGTAGAIAQERLLADLQSRLDRVRYDMQLARAEMSRLAPISEAETRAELEARQSREAEPTRGRRRTTAAPGVDLDTAITAAREHEDALRRQAEASRYWLGVDLELRRQLGEQQLAWQDELDERMYAKAEAAARQRIELERLAQEQHAETVRMGAEMLVSAIDIGIGRGAAAMASYISRELRGIGVSESVKALVSLASGDVVSAGRHAAAAAAAFAGSATVASLFPGSGGGGGGGAGGGASAAARATAQGSSGGAQEQSGGSVTIIINGDLLGDEGSGRRISEYIEAYRDRQSPGRQQSRVRV